MASRKTLASNNQNDTSSNLLSQRNHLRSTQASGGMNNSKRKRLLWRSAKHGHGVAAFRALLKCYLSFYLQKNITETFNSPSSTPEAIPWEQWLSNTGFYNSSWPQEHIVYWKSFSLLQFHILSFIVEAMCGAQLQPHTPQINGSMSLAHLYSVLKQPDTHWLVSLLLPPAHNSRLCVSCLYVCVSTVQWCNDLKDFEDLQDWTLLSAGGCCWRLVLPLKPLAPQEGIGLDVQTESASR